MADSNPTTQLVDSRIVSLLGLQDDLELSHEDYFRALREFALAARMSDSKIPSGDILLITEELKRVRKEDKNIKFQTEKKKVKAKPKTQKVSNNTKKPPKTTAPKPNTKVTSLSTFVQKEPRSTVAEPQSPPQATPTVPLLPQPKKKTVEVKEKKQKIKKEGCCEVLGKKLTKIDSTLGSIFSTLKDQFSLRKKDSERERRGREKSGREDAENKLEKGSGIKEIVNVAKNLLSPFQDLFDRIKRFIVFTLLGKAFTMFMDWMKDPKNRQTFTTIVKFLTDHWVLIVGSYLLFGTRLGGLVRSISKLVVKMAVKAVIATGKLIAVLAKSKWGRVALAAGAVTAGAVAISQSGKKKDDNQDVESYAKGGIIGGIGDALKFTPLGMAFEAGKHGAKAVGKVASGATDFLGKGLKKSLDVATLPLTIGFKGLAGASEFLMNGLKSLDLFKLLAGPIQSITKKGGDKDPKLQAVGGIPGLIGTIVQKTSEGIGKNVKDSKKSKTEGKDRGTGYAKGGVINPLTMGLMGAVPGLGAFAPLLSPLLQSKKIGGGHGLPISGAGKDDRLLKLRTGDAILTEKDQKQLSSGNFLEKFGGPMGAMASFFSGKKSGKETVVAAKKGEAVVTQEDQLNIFEKTGINIPSLLSGRKPSKVSSDQLKTKSGKNLPGFFNGGMIEGYASGGIVGGTSVLDLGKKMSGDPDHKFDPTLAQSIPLLYRMLQSGRFKEKGWGDKKFMDQLTARLLVESKNFSRAKEMYNSDPRDPKGKEGYQYFSGYSGMIGNKNADDAYNFRGRGAIQLTGRDNYQGFNKWLARNGHKGVDVIKNPDLLSKDPKVQALSTLYYLEDREKTFGVNFADMAKKGDSKSFTYNINGGYNHLAETQDNLRRIQGLSGGVNYGKGFAPAAPKPKAAPRNPIMDIASKGMSAIGNIFAPPASAAPKPKAAPKSAAPKPKRWAIDPRGWVGKKDGGIIEPRKQSNKFDTNIRQNKLLGNHVDRSIDQSLPFTMADYLEQQQDNDIPIAPITPEQIQEGRTHLKNKSIHNFLRYNSKMKGGGIVKKQGGGLVEKSISEQIRSLRGLRADSLERQGETNSAYGLRAFNLQKAFKNFNTNDIFKKSKYSFNLNDAFKNYFDKSKNANEQKKANPYTNLNNQKPKKQSIADTLKELREMRARSLDRQGKSLDAVTLPPPPSIDSATNLPIKTTTDAPPPPKIDTPPIQKKAGGGIIKKISSGIGGFFNKNKKRDIVKKAISKTVSKGDSIKGNVENYTNKSSEKKKGFWGGIYDTVSSINSGVNMAKGFIKKVNPIKSAKNAANFIGGNVKKLSNVVGKKGSDILSAAAQNPKMIKIGGAFGKFGGRMVPGLGVAASAADAAARAEKGDKWGAALAGLGAGSGAATIATSGAAATGVGAVVPAVAEAVSMGADLSLLGKDIWDILSSKENKSSGKNKIISNNRQKNSLKNTVSSKANMMQGGGIIKLQGGGIIPTGLAAPPPPLIDTATNLPIIMTTNAPSSPTVTSPFKPIQPKPSTSLAPIKKSMMQRQADELRAMRANSLERQRRTSESYGQRAFGTGKDFSSFFAKGMVMENTGMNMLGGTADRQLTALQPGEYVIPKQTVNAFGGASFFDNMVAKTDSDSNAAKLGSRSKSNIGGGIKPYPINNSKKPKVTNLGSAKEARSGAQLSQGRTQNGASKEVFFEALCQEASAPSERQRIMDLLGVNS